MASLHAEWIDEDAEPKADTINPFDPFVQWLANGGFVYCDHTFDIVAINAVCLHDTDRVEMALFKATEESDGARKGWAPLRKSITSGQHAAQGPPDHRRAETRSSLMLSPPCSLPLSAIEPLAKYGRWWPITNKELTGESSCDVCDVHGVWPARD
jgi:hypothetical protein